MASKKRTSRKPSNRASRARESAEHCRSLYRFIRLRLGNEISDREIARRWGMEWKSFAGLKHGQRQVPRLRELEKLAAVLDVDRAAVFMVAVGADPVALAHVAPPSTGPVRLPSDFFTLDRIPAACLLVDSSRRIVAANPLVERICPSTATEIVGRTMTEVFGDSGPGCPVERAFVTGQIEQQVTWRTNRAGQRVYIHRTVGPILDGGRVDKVIEIVIDVTEQVRHGDLRVLSFWRAEADGEPGALPAERRTTPRAEVAFSAQIRWDGKTEMVRVENLGSGGLFIRTDKRIAKGTELELEWLLPNDRFPVRARAIVAWTRTTRKGRGVGLRFLHLAPAPDSSRAA
jgi:uncharacterized protein (TIGR02266 family)